VTGRELIDLAARRIRVCTALAINSLRFPFSPVVIRIVARLGATGVLRSSMAACARLSMSRELSFFERRLELGILALQRLCWRIYHPLDFDQQLFVVQAGPGKNNRFAPLSQGRRPLLLHRSVRVIYENRPTSRNRRSAILAGPPCRTGPAIIISKRTKSETWSFKAIQPSVGVGPQLYQVALQDQHAHFETLGLSVSSFDT